MTEQTIHIPLQKLRPNPYQPRKVFDPHALDELAASIRQQGIIQPLIVRKRMTIMRSWLGSGAGVRHGKPVFRKCRR